MTREYRGLTLLRDSPPSPSSFLADEEIGIYSTFPFEILPNIGPFRLLKWEIRFRPLFDQAVFRHPPLSPEGFPSVFEESKSEPLSRLSTRS